MDDVEIIDEYRDGVLVKRTANGIPIQVGLPEDDFATVHFWPKMIIWRETLTMDEFYKRYGKR